MTKKIEMGEGVLVFDATSKENIKADGKAVRTSRRKPAKLHAKMPHIDMQKTRAQYHFASNMQGYGLQPLRANELKSVYALLAWIANEQKASVDTVQSMTETQFRVKDVTSLQQKDYEEVIKFLVDLRIDELRH